MMKERVHLLGSTGESNQLEMIKNDELSGEFVQFSKNWLHM